MDVDPLSPLPGVRLLDHTADVGLELEAPELAALIGRAAAGLTWLLWERAPHGSPRERTLHVEASMPPELLREALRELLWWHEREGQSLVALKEMRVERGPEGLTFLAIARLVEDPLPPLREIKGVTLHGLAAEPRGEGWYGRVVFDV